MSAVVVCAASRCYSWLVHLFDWDSGYEAESDSENDAAAVVQPDTSDGQVKAGKPPTQSAESSCRDHLDKAKRLEDKANTIRLEDKANTIRPEDKANTIRPEDKANMTRPEDTANMTRPEDTAKTTRPEDKAVEPYANTQQTVGGNSAKPQPRKGRTRMRFASEPLEEFIRRSSTAELDMAITLERRRQRRLEAKIRSLSAASRSRERNVKVGPCYPRNSSLSPTRGLRRRELSCGSVVRSRQQLPRANERKSRERISKHRKRWLTFCNVDVINRLTLRTSSSTKMITMRKEQERALNESTSDVHKCDINIKPMHCCHSNPMNFQFCSKETKFNFYQSTINHAITNCPSKPANLCSNLSKSDIHHGHVKIKTTNCPSKPTKCRMKESKDVHNGDAKTKATDCSSRSTKLRSKKLTFDIRNGDVKIKATNYPSKPAKRCSKKSTSDVHEGDVSGTCPSMPMDLQSKVSKPYFYSGDVDTTGTNRPWKTNKLKVSKYDVQNNEVNITGPNHPYEISKLKDSKSDAPQGDIGFNGTKRRRKRARSKKSKSDGQCNTVSEATVLCQSVQTLLCRKTLTATTARTRDGERITVTRNPAAPRRRPTRRNNRMWQRDGVTSARGSIDVEALATIYRKGLTQLTLDDLFCPVEVRNEAKPWTDAAGIKNVVNNQPPRHVNIHGDVAVGGQHNLNSQVAWQASTQQDGRKCKPGTILRDNQIRVANWR